MIFSSASAQLIQLLSHSPRLTSFQQSHNYGLSFPKTHSILVLRCVIVCMLFEIKEWYLLAAIKHFIQSISGYNMTTD